MEPTDQSAESREGQANITVVYVWTTASERPIIGIRSSRKSSPPTIFF